MQGAFDKCVSMSSSLWGSACLSPCFPEAEGTHLGVVIHSGGRLGRKLNQKWSGSQVFWGRSCQGARLSVTVLRAVRVTVL